jgi:hypothetical protein
MVEVIWFKVRDNRAATAWCQECRIALVGFKYQPSSASPQCTRAKARYLRTDDAVWLLACSLQHQRQERTGCRLSVGATQRKHIRAFTDRRQEFESPHARHSTGLVGKEFGIRGRNRC